MNEYEKLLENVSDKYHIYRELKNLKMTGKPV